MTDALGGFGLTHSIETEKEFEIFECNVETLNAFIYCADDWTYTPQGKPKSIDKQAMKAIIEMLSIDNIKQTFTDLVAMQDAIVRHHHG